MESKRAFVEAYISARYPRTRVCGSRFPTSYLIDLYPYQQHMEVTYLLDLFTLEANRRRFEAQVLPATKLIMDPMRAEDVFLRSSEFSTAMVKETMRRKDEQLLAWFMNFGEPGGTCDQIHDALGLMHEIMSTVYHQPDMAFHIWFPTQADFEAQRRDGWRGAPVNDFVEQYFLFLHTAGIKNLRQQNKKAFFGVGLNMTTRKRVQV